MTLVEFLHKYGLTGSPSLSAEDEISTEALERFVAAQMPIASFQDLEAALPMGLRYIGPGAWLQAIKETYTPPEGSISLSTNQTRRHP